MFYVPFKFRESKTRITPKGPNFSWAQTICTNIGGTEIRFKAPRHKSGQLASEPRFPQKYYDAKYLPFLPPYIDKDKPRHVVEKWRKFEFFYHSWTFNGPWFTGIIAELDVWVSLIQVKGYPSSMSLFHPRALERVIDDYLSHRFSQCDTFYNNIQKHLAPLHWQPLSHVCVNAARCIVHPLTPTTTFRNDRHFVFLPFTNDMMLFFEFNPLRPGLEPECIKDRYSDITPVNKLIDNIINSIEVKLSPAAQEDQRIALEGLEDTRLTTDFPPIKWDNLDEKTRAEVLAKIERERIEEYGF